MALTKVTRGGITADAVDGTKIEDDAINSEHYAATSVDNAHINDLAASKLTGALPAISGASLTGIAATLAALTDATVSASDPATDTNPSATGHYWVNKTSGECYVCTTATTDANVWTNVGPGTGDIAPVEYVAATGPDSAAGVTDGDYKYHIFNATKTGSDAFVVSNAGNAAGSNTVEYLVVAGGGASGHAQASAIYSGGGGAGGYRTATGLTCPAVGNTNVTVGAGAASQSAPGSDSVFSSITSTGGGGGGGYRLQADDGGSGGGQGTDDTGLEEGSGNTPSTSPAQGYDGGDQFDYTGGAGGGGGGGGATAVGGDGASGVGGNGGTGGTSSISGSSVQRSGGGGGGGSTTGGTATGGGGAGYSGADGVGTAGTVNTGGGGGGSCSYTSSSGALGGSGVVIIRYKFQN